MERNNLRQMRKLIYDLKRREGLRGEVINVTNTEITDLCTGNITRDYDRILVRRMVFLPQDITRQFVYDLAYIASNKNFTSGGYFDQDVRVVLIDRRDLGTLAPISNSTYIRVVKNDNIYLVEEVENYEDDAAYILKCKRTTNFTAADLAPVVP